MRKLIDKERDSLACLQDNQRVEMESLIQTHSPQDIIADVVDKHVYEMNNTEQTWKVEILQAKERQKLDYQEFVCGMYRNSDKKELSIAENVKKDHQAQLKQDSAEAGDMSHERYETFTVYLGSQLKTPYNIQLGNGKIQRFCASKTSNAKPSVKKQIKLYSTALSGVVLMVDEKLSFTSAASKEFMSACNSTTEFHFDDVQAQLETAKKKAAGAKLCTGDFVVTKHSNLSHVHVVFHMVVEQGTTRSMDGILSGLRNILSVAAQYDICKLTIPVFFVQPEFKHLYSTQILISRAEETIKSLRQFLIQNSRIEIPLRTIQLIHPMYSNQFERVRELLKTTFNKNPVM